MLFFYQPEITNNHYFLEDEEYQHCVKVLRKKSGDEIGILDGSGNRFRTRITEITNKQCRFEILDHFVVSKKGFYNHIALAPTKNTDRTEWFVEKACEMGVDEISFILTQNSERPRLRTDRLEKKVISALKQSKSGFLTKINSLISWDEFLKGEDAAIKLIAVVEDQLPYCTHLIRKNTTVLTAIGPEGDFDPKETETALEAGFQKVSLGTNTLRTETAGLVAAQMVNVMNDY